MLEVLKQEVYEANIELVNKGVVIYTWGNVSGVDRNHEFVVIKPSGVEYSLMKPSDMVVVDLKTGKCVEGELRPSSDLQTHLELYREFPSVGGITHTHSTNAVAFAQAGLGICPMGTTHADYFYGEIPCTRELTEKEVLENYELNTGKVICETLKKKNVDVVSVPGVLVKGHGPFAWGRDAAESVYNAVVMEKVADMAIKTLYLKPNVIVPQYVLDKHYTRKHGKNAYYGQK